MKYFFISLLIFAVSAAHAAPAEILLIRHAEKPKKGPEGTDLSKRGYKRAAALAEFFASDSRVTDLGVASIVYAASPDKATGSNRPLETVEPTATRLGLKVNTDYKTDEYEDLASELLSNPRYQGKVVILCWPHDQLGDFANALGVRRKLKWDSSTFDRVWKIKYDGNSVSSFDDLPQMLLKGDSSK